MKTLARRSICAVVLALLFACGLAFFISEYMSDAGDWVTYPSNQHIYKSGVLTRAGQILDSEGEVLAHTVNSERVYNPSKSIRRATVHVVGDRQGNIATSLQRAFRDDLVGYNLLTGIGTGVGFDLTTTLSAEATAKTLEAMGNRKGAVGVYNYKTGEIIVLATSPTFDPDSPPKLTEKNEEQYRGMFINRFFSSTFTPGSVFKIITTAAALDTLPDVLDEEFECNGTLLVDGEKITCPKKHGKLTLGQAMTVSCNTSYAVLAAKIGAENLSKYAASAGFGSQLYVDGIRLGVSRFDLSKANSADLAWAGIGQYTDLANPCHFMTIMGAIANGGQPVMPHIVSRVTIPASGDGFDVYTADSGTGARMFSESASAKLAELMRANVKDNYGDKQFGKLNVCAKSGTAEIGGDKKPHAWFAGFVTDESTPLAFVVMLENSGSGSGVAAPIAAAAIKAAAKTLS